VIHRELAISRCRLELSANLLIAEAEFFAGFLLIDDEVDGTDVMSV